MNVIPVFPCRELDSTLDFYRALGFVVTHVQTKPYVFGAVELDGLSLTFTAARGAAKNQSGGYCLVIVKDVAEMHRAFANGLRVHYGRVPTAGEVRITRLQPGQMRFHVYDPAGNALLFIDADEPEVDYEAHDETLSPLGRALVNAAFARDTYNNDASAANLLDRALAQAAKKQWEGVDVVQRARALAARAEIAVALGDTARAAKLQAELEGLALPDEAWEAYGEELEAPRRLARWIESGDEEVEG